MHAPRFPRTQTTDSVRSLAPRGNHVCRTPGNTIWNLDMDRKNRMETGGRPGDETLGRAFGLVRGIARRCKAIWTSVPPRADYEQPYDLDQYVSRLEEENRDLRKWVRDADQRMVWFLGAAILEAFIIGLLVAVIRRGHL